jgi:hypothetical protein
VLRTVRPRAIDGDIMIGHKCFSSRARGTAMKRAPEEMRVSLRLDLPNQKKLLWSP